MIKKVTEDLEENHYNTAIAAIMETLNSLYKLKTEFFGQNLVWQQALENIVAVVAPFSPHIADELWLQLGHSTSVHKDTWPKWEDKYLVSDTVTVIVQVNGKLRAKLSVPADSNEDQVIDLAKSNEKVVAYLKDQTIKKSIYVPKKIVNFVV